LNKNIRHQNIYNKTQIGRSHNEDARKQPVNMLLSRKKLRRCANVTANP
jgi:hypothetical protein